MLTKLSPPHSNNLLMRTGIQLLGGLTLLILAAAWKFGLAPQWTQRLPPAWTWQADYIGISTFTDPNTGEIPAEDSTGIYERSIRIVSETERPRAVQVEDTYTTRDINTGQITWEYILNAEVNPATGEHLEPQFRGQYLVFPRRVEKKAYRLRSNYLKDIPVAYQSEENIEGLTTYLFAYEGRGEYTESYLGTEQYPGVPIEAGQEIKCAEDQLVIKLWVEPLTGEVLKVEESCLSGDYIYDIASGQKIAAILRWAGTTAGDDILIRADQIRAERTRLLWFDVYIPIITALTGILLLFWYGMQRSVARARNGTDET
ncbi:MAG: porin PorA family protein [Anaerolineales bacterium]